MKITLDSTQEAALRGQAFDDLHPGALLHDFAVVLDYVGEKGVPAAGKHHGLPMQALPVLDPKLARPLRPDLKRPQLRSHPYLQGLYLLARASTLVRVETQGKSARLVIDAETKRSWDELNAVERHFSLLEAWLIHSRADMLGERDHREALLPAFASITLHKGNRASSLKALPFFVMRDRYHAALFELFGWASFTAPVSGNAARRDNPSGHLTPFGVSMIQLLGDVAAAQYEANEDLYDEDESFEPPAFGVLQPLLQPYFPAWQKSLTVSVPPSGNGEGVYVWRLTISGRKSWWLLALDHDHTLDDLMAAILDALDFDFDHLYEFRYRDALGREVSALHPEADEGIPADEVTLGTLPLKVGETLKVTYDFGDDWRFDVKLERIDPPGSVKKLPKVLDSHGKAPEQYPDSDWE